MSVERCSYIVSRMHARMHVCMRVFIRSLTPCLSCVVSVSSLNTTMFLWFRA